MQRGATDHQNFYPRSPYGERRGLVGIGHDPRGISIHALLTESDYINLVVGHQNHQFLSTLSLRRATNHEATF